MTTTEKAIRSFSGKSNSGLRKLIRGCTTGREVMALASRVGLTNTGAAKLRGVAETLPHGAEYDVDGQIVTCQRPYGHDMHCAEDSDD